MGAPNSEARKAHDLLDRSELRDLSRPTLPTPVADALDLLHELEWIIYEDGTVHCPDCRAHEVNGHHEDCGLAHVLRVLGAEVLPHQLTSTPVEAAANHEGHIHAGYACYGKPAPFLREVSHGE